MSQHLEAFFAEAAKNPELQARITEILDEGAKRTALALAGLSQTTSTPFTAEEFLAPSPTEEKAELSEDSLASVNGGLSFGEIGAIGGAVAGAALSVVGLRSIRVLSQGTVAIAKIAMEAIPAVVGTGTAAGYGIGKTVDKLTS